ncbi:hypothetical protein IKE83_02500 [Candidatus Saccharibacteria bacterium]|nr:hypothetical protein [Candidatus Saccharibacteria bacterium]MBR2831206.1 hypothetical protein [Candidatus Saccharibacteria bacterium]
MKTDLATAIGVAIVGALIAFFITNLFMGGIEDYPVKTVSSEVSTDLEDPDPEVFNYKALNPTVEVYVGECKQFDSYGQCIDQIKEETKNQGAK